MLKSFEDLLALFSIAELARELDVPYQTAAGWKRRGTISLVHWQQLMRLAAARGEVLTATMLLDFATRNAVEKLTAEGLDEG
jgi:hypothetical protein